MAVNANDVVDGERSLPFQRNASHCSYSEHTVINLHIHLHILNSAKSSSTYNFEYPSFRVLALLTALPISA